MMLSQLGSAIVLEVGAIALALREDRSLLGYYSFLLTHAMASGLFALVVYPLLPAYLRRPRPPVLLLCFALSFFVPFFGVLALWTAVGVMRWLPLRRARNRFRLAPLPELPQSARGDGRRFRELSVRPVLADTGLAVALRTPALNALTSMPVRVVGDLLQRLLVDPAEEMRLVAYGLLDRREKDLRRRIEEQRSAVEACGPQTPTVVLGLRLRALAELHFELVYQRLVQGDLRRHALEQALQHADQAIARIGAEPGLLQLRARVHLEAGRLEQAQDDLQWAAQMGAPAVRVLPYMAELAYRQGDWAEVRRLLARLEHLPVTPRVAALVRFWGHPGGTA